MARTRRQVTLQEQGGQPASPLHSLPTPRLTRVKRTTARSNDNNATAAPMDPPPSTRSGPAVRGGRIAKAKRVGRNRTQLQATTVDNTPDSATDVDGPEASDSLTQSDVAVQADPITSIVSDDHHEVENVKEINVESSGETHSPTSVPAHPVQSEDVIAHPVQGSTTPPERRESATSLLFREILKSSSLSPNTNSGRFSPKAVASTVPNPTLEHPVGASTPTTGPPHSSSPVVKPSIEASTRITADSPPASPHVEPSVEASTRITADSPSATPTIKLSVEAATRITGESPSASPHVEPSVEASTRITEDSPSASPLVKPMSKASPPTTGSPFTASPLTPSLNAFSPTTRAFPSISPRVKPVQQAPSPASATPVYYMPTKPKHSHSLITIRMDYFQGSKDDERPSKPAAFAVPSELIAPICRFIESRATQGSDLSKITTDHPAVHAIVHGDARYRPRLPNWQSQQSPPNPKSSMRHSFIRKLQRKRGLREMEEETATLMAENVKLKATVAEKSNESPPKRTKLVPDPWTADGKLLLGRTKEIEVHENGVAVDPTEEPNILWNDIEDRKKAKLEQARRIADVRQSPYVAEEVPDTDGPAIGGLFAESQEEVQPEPEPVPETPTARRWGLSRLLPSARSVTRSARSVTRFIPFSSRLTTPTPQQEPSQPQQTPQTEPQVDGDNSQPPREPDAVESVTNASPSHQQPRSDAADNVANASHQQPRSDAADNVANASHRRQQPRSNQQRLLTKQQAEEDRRSKKMRAQVIKEREVLEQQKRDFEIQKKDFEEQRKLADVAQTPGKKRKRAPSPDVIPLPAGGGFGLVDEYFLLDSSSDEDVAGQETPTKERPSQEAQIKERPSLATQFFERAEKNAAKRARISARDDGGSPYRARPYTGTLFAHPDAQRSRREGNLFVEPSKIDAETPLDSTPPPGPTLVFKVPSPGSSDSDDEDDEPEQSGGKFQPTPSRNAPEPKSILRKSASGPSRSSVSFASPEKTLAPPPRPNPSHATLPATTSMASSDALEKAREKALKHQPKQPSTLRESSRLSSSTAGSDVGDEADVEEYDPKNPAIVSSPGKVARSELPSPSVVSPFGQPAVSSTTSDFQQSVTQINSKQPHKQPHEQQAVPKTTEKRVETEYTDSNGANILHSKIKIKTDLDHWWKENGDSLSLLDGYDDFEAKLVAEEQALMDGPNGDPYNQPRNIISAALDRVGEDSLSDRGIQTAIEENWRPGDLERTESDPANGMRVFFNRLVKNGDIERGVADQVVELGVPPGITAYLAGQDPMSPVAA